MLLRCHLHLKYMQSVRRPATNNRWLISLHRGKACDVATHTPSCKCSRHLLALCCAAPCLLGSAHPTSLSSFGKHTSGKRRLRSARSTLFECDGPRLVFLIAGCSFPSGNPEPVAHWLPPTPTSSHPLPMSTPISYRRRTGLAAGQRAPPPAWDIALPSPLSGCVCRGLLVPIYRDRVHGPL
ncbi:hypothetical protein LZ31DRAFT_41719 [Colletotrichum somersetense]|nr:hypothetical protein LZ31DRAFT_41719 [Colletotrichum somersetense]